jgi:SAM-dependent methyltransferase
LVRSNPIIDQKRINALYVQSCFIFGKEAPYTARTYASLLKKMMKDHISGKISSLLEIGSSTGFFLEEAMAMGFHDVAGFEPSKDCYAHAREAVKCRIINSVYDPAALGGKTFDLACSFHVFDHLTDPIAALVSIKHCLNPGGYVLLVCHDVESWSAKLLGDHSPIFDVEHIYLFSRKTVRKLFESVGFRILEVGSLANCYPLGYWMRMLPFANRAAHRLPSFLGNIPITLNGGNLYAFGQLPRGTHAD